MPRQKAGRSMNSLVGLGLHDVADADEPRSDSRIAPVAPRHRQPAGRSNRSRRPRTDSRRQARAAIAFLRASGEPALPHRHPLWRHPFPVGRRPAGNPGATRPSSRLSSCTRRLCSARNVDENRFANLDSFSLYRWNRRAAGCTRLIARFDERHRPDRVVDR